MELKKNIKDVLTLSFYLRGLKHKKRHVPFSNNSHSQGSKVFGKRHIIYNIAIVFNTLMKILCSQEILCLAFTAATTSCCLFSGLLAFSFVFSNWSCSAGLRSGDWLGHRRIFSTVLFCLPECEQAIQPYTPQNSSNRSDQCQFITWIHLSWTNRGLAHTWS